jgi:predicted Zn-dependent protease with MMP-like domain
MAYHVGRQEFELLAEEALKTIPKKYLRNFRNLTVIVEDQPGDDAIQFFGVRKDELLGLFKGAGYAGGGFFDTSAMLPDSIILYQKNIEAICGSRQQLVEEIRITIVHEVGHYFGMSDDELAQYE